MAQQVDHVGLGGTGDRNNRGNVLVRVRDVQRSFVQASTVSVDDGGGHVEDVVRGGNTSRVLIGPTLRVGGSSHRTTVASSETIGLLAAFPTKTSTQRLKGCDEAAGVASAVIFALRSFTVGGGTLGSELGNSLCAFFHAFALTPPGVVSAQKPKGLSLAVVHGAFASSATADCIFAHDMIKIIEVTYNNDALILSFIVNVSLGEDPALILPCHE